MARAQAELVERAVRNALPTIGHRSAEGDPSRLRGIPAIGRGVGGAIPGTHPEHVVIGAAR